MAAEKDYSFLIGNTYGHLTVLERSEPVVKRNGKKEKAYKCRCDCGKIVNIAAWRIVTGDAKSCGCYKHPERMIGKKYGRLTVVKRIEDRHFPSGSKQVQFECRCDCGNIVVATAGHLRDGHTKSCGCLKCDTAGVQSITHGGSSERLYRVWKNMVRRCEDPKTKNYNSYGGRGIRVCEEWHDYATFRDWANSTGYDSSAARGECTIDRIDVDGDYCPENCQWSDAVGQARNKRNTVYITLNGVKKTVIDWSIEYGIDPDLVRTRLRSGWNCVDALTTKSGDSKVRYITIDGVTKPLREWLDIYGTNFYTFYTRIHKGWSEVDAVTTKANAARKGE